MVISDLGGGYHQEFLPFVKRKAERVLVPYITVGLFLCVWQHRELIQMINGIAHLWFLLAIFECYVFFRCVDFLYTRERCIAIIVVSYVVLFLYKMHPIPYPIIGNFIYLGTYYSTGMALSRLYDMKIMTDGRKLLVILIACVAMYLAVLLVLNKPRVSTLFGLNVIIATFLCLGTVMRNMMTSWMMKIDAASMGIYIFQQIIIQTINSIPRLHPFIIDHYYIYPNLLFIVVFILSYGMVVILRRWSWSKYIIG